MDSHGTNCLDTFNEKKIRDTFIYSTYSTELREFQIYLFTFSLISKYSVRGYSFCGQDRHVRDVEKVIFPKYKNKWWNQWSRQLCGPVQPVYAYYNYPETILGSYHCNGISSTLIRSVLQWYINLPNGSIHSFAALTDQFVRKFACTRNQAESLRNYTICFNQEKVFYLQERHVAWCWYVQGVNQVSVQNHGRRHIPSMGRSKMGGRFSIPVQAFPKAWILSSWEIRKTKKTINPIISQRNK